MRATLQSINRNIITDLNLHTADLQSITKKISSGKEISAPSDDPVGMVAVLNLRSNLEEIKQYQENLSYGADIAESSGNILTQIKDLVVDARTKAASMIDGAIHPDQYASVAIEVRSFMEQIVILGNTQVGGRYIFGGHRIDGYTADEPAPFMIDRINGYRINGTQPPSTDQLAGPPPAPQPVPLAAGDLVIDGQPIGASVSDGLSEALPFVPGPGTYDEASAQAKANAINAEASLTGVTAEVVPVSHRVLGSVEAGTLDPGDLLINGVDIFAGGSTAIVADDVDNVLIDAINAEQVNTGIVATRNNSGQLILTAVDGRNLHIETTTINAEQITHLTDPLLTFPAIPGDRVYYGSLQLHSEDRFILESTLPGDAGLDIIGVAGGTAVTGEPDDTAADGRILVDHVQFQDESVRYTGDRDHDLDIRVGRSSTLTVGRNGEDVLMDSGVFETLEAFYDALQNQEYTRAVGVAAAADTTVTLDSGDTGLPELPAEQALADGFFSVTMIDQAYYPPTRTTYEIGVDVANDSLDTVVSRLNDVPGLDAAWNPNGYLEIDSADPERYNFELSHEDSGGSNFLRAVGLRYEDVQVGAIEQAFADLDVVFEDLTTKMVDFGSRANRIMSQKTIYVDLDLIATENLSDRQDADMVKSLVDLKTREVAYEAALQASARAMNLSLVDFI